MPSPAPLVRWVDRIAPAHLPAALLVRHHVVDDPPGRRVLLPLVAVSWLHVGLTPVGVHYALRTVQQARRAAVPTVDGFPSVLRLEHVVDRVFGARPPVSHETPSPWVSIITKMVMTQRQMHIEIIQVTPSL
jgi:hypothetical protein